MKPQWSSNFPALANLLRPERNREAMGRRWADGWRCRAAVGAATATSLPRRRAPWGP